LALKLNCDWFVRSRFVELLLTEIVAPLAGFAWPFCRLKFHWRTPASEVPASTVSVAVSTDAA
jgi:hypothetical protein